MRRNRFLSVCVVLVVIVAVAQGCARGPSEEELALAAFQEQFAALQQSYDALTQVRSDIEVAEQTVAEIEAVEERQRTDEQNAELEALSAQLETLAGSSETAFEEVQGLLADFLNIGINDYPDSQETADALVMYSDEAILVAQDMVAKAGDYKKAIDHLSNAEGYFSAAGLTPYHPLQATIAYFDEWRFITQERFDEIKKGMTKEEVAEVAGQVYYRNVQVSESKGVETWLYKKREGGAAAVYFKTRTDKVYDKRFDAVAATTVAED
jgi:hypothetical protein